MAKLSTVTLDVHGNRLELYSEETNVDTSNNRSTVHSWLNLYVVNGGSVKSYDVKVNITGSYEQNLGYREYYSGNHTLIESTYTVNHNEDGSGSAYVSGYFHGGFGSWDLSGTLNLAKINRGFTTRPTLNVITRKPHSITFRWTTSQYCSKIMLTMGGTTTQVFSGKAKIGQFTIDNLTPDTSYTALGVFTREDTGGTSSSLPVSTSTKKIAARVKVNGVWKEAMPYVRVNGVWKEAIPHTRVNNEWKEGI